MTRAEALTELREVLNDSIVTYLWADSTLLGYLSEGQDKFCEKTGYFRDFGSEPITLVEDQIVYAIPARTIQILDIWDGPRRLGKFQEEDRGLRDSTLDFAETVARTGNPRAWQTDRSVGFITFDSTPTLAEAGTELQLFLWRYSADDLADTDIEPEIPSRFHRALVEWATYKALMHHDGEQQDPVKAADHLRSFEQYAREGKRALQRIQGMETRVGTDPSYRV